MGFLLLILPIIILFIEFNTIAYYQYIGRSFVRFPVLSSL